MVPSLFLLLDNLSNPLIAGCSVSVQNCVYFNHYHRHRRHHHHHLDTLYGQASSQQALTDPLSPWLQSLYDLQFSLAYPLCPSFMMLWTVFISSIWEMLLSA